MHTAVLSRPQPLGSATHRVPRKSASFLSLRREKDKASVYQDPYAVKYDPSGSKSSYFEAYPRPKSANARSSRSKPAPPAPPPPSSPDDVSFSDHTLREKKATKRHLETWPIYSHPQSLPTTGPSRKPYEWDEPPALRFSGSSTQNTETPPDTPIDNISFRDFQVLVAAPISGVETMDALVDGMNGGDDMMSSSLSRARFGIPGHHPLYQPPLPTPPPGVVLGGGKIRKPRKSPRPPAHRSSYSGDEEDEAPPPASTPHKRRPKRNAPTRSNSNATITLSVSGPSESPPIDYSPTPSYTSTPLSRRSSRDSLGTHSLQERPKSVAPSISDIIRAYAPAEAKARSRVSLHRASSYAHSHDHATVHEESEPEPEPLTKEEEAEFLSRSSIDSVADEVQRTLRNQIAMKPVPIPPPPPSSYTKRHSTISDNASLYSPRSDGGSASIYSMSVSSHPPHSPFETSTIFNSLAKPSTSQAVAQYLRSARLTTLLRLTRSPHASQDNPLTVSLSDLGNPSGIPIVVFLGLGCVRHIMGLYDEMAECLGLRLITIDRWGLGRTEPRSKSAKGIMQWASVVEEVLDLLHIEECSVMAHSAGAPYALSFSNKLRKRIRGISVYWHRGYKWLKYVPNGLLKTAQAAEWKLQAWMIGKPPTIAYEGIGFNFQSPPKSPSRSNSLDPPVNSGNHNTVYPSSIDGTPPRPSMTSSTFSEYDDLRDFDGRFESRSTLGVDHHRAGRNEKVPKRKPSRGFLDRFKGPSSPPTQSSMESKPQTTGRRLKALRSMSSLKSKPSSPSKSSEPSSPQLPPTLKFDVGLGFDDLTWTRSGGSSQTSLPRNGDHTHTPDKFSTTGHSTYRANGRRSLSFNSPNGPLSLPSSPQDTTFSSNASLPPHGADGSKDGYQAMLANALIAASHSESAKGTHNDLLQILNHDNHPWGFSYSSYPHNVKVWYGDRDEKIAEHAVRWMERNMGEDRCNVKVVRGADHGLMYKSSVVVEVLEHLLGFWQNGAFSSSSIDWFVLGGD
ncbi:hypothetical protein BDZ89DRAFT_1130070 [Hymenopellis radicata]|nr:hypothetical protein BDZ89DRAFT_1130070 [Hymenopellis radicata]